MNYPTITPAQLIPGDCLVYQKTGFVPWAIRKATNCECTHTARYIGRGEVWEAIAKGYKPRTLAVSLADGSVRVFVKRALPRRNDFAIVMRCINDMRNARYEFGGLIHQLYMHIKNNGQWIGDKEVKRSVFCSKADAYIFAECGIEYYKDKWYKTSPDVIMGDHVNFETFELIF